MIKEQAVRWAKRFDQGAVNFYEFKQVEGLKILNFENLTDEWLDFIVDCRSGKKHDFDMVIGAMADDQIYNYVNQFLAVEISREQFWVMMKFKYPTHQICFCTEKSLQCIKYLKTEVVNG